MNFGASNSEGRRGRVMATDTVYGVGGTDGVDSHLAGESGMMSVAAEEGGMAIVTGYRSN